MRILRRLFSHAGDRAGGFHATRRVDGPAPRHGSGTASAATAAWRDRPESQSSGPQSRATLPRSGQLTTLGDRLFRAGNFKKAEERYLQAIRAAPDLANPVSGELKSRWFVVNTAPRPIGFARPKPPNPVGSSMRPDIQALYGEPTDFANNVARLETHLQANPDDRDAWLVLGAEWFLSGRTTKAADVFKRLNDPNRKPDVALAAFLDASNQAELKAAKPPDAEPPVPLIGGDRPGRSQ